MKRFSILLCVLMLFAALPSAMAQDKNQLKQQQKDIKQEIREKNELLKQTKQEKKVSLTQLAILKKQIVRREELIVNINTQIRVIDNEINDRQKLIATKEAELEVLKDEYGKMLFQAYKHRSKQDKLMYVFAAESFNQAYKRLKYYEQYNAYRLQQAELIIATKEEINRQVQKLEQSKADKQSLLGVERVEKENLIADQDQQQQVVRNLQSKEQQVKTEIAQKQKEYNQLQAAIKRIIEDEIRRERELAEKEGRKFFTNRAEYKALSKDFSNNKGKLPWPVDKGDISTGFGRQQFKEVAGVEINNNGVEISTVQGSMARAVFPGKVSGVVVIPGMGKAVIIRHGEFLTVYSKLKETLVSTGDEVKERQELGTIQTDPDSGVAELHFEVRQEQKPLNPTEWLYKTK